MCRMTEEEFNQGLKVRGWSLCDLSEAVTVQTGVLLRTENIRKAFKRDGVLSRNLTAALRLVFKTYEVKHEKA